MMQGLEFCVDKHALAYHSTELIMIMQRLMIQVRCIKCYDTSPKCDHPLKLFWRRLILSSLPQYRINYDRAKAYDTGPMYKIS